MSNVYARMYKKAKGSHVSIPADIVGKYMEDVETKYGSLTTKNLTDQIEADGPKGPIASAFTWDKKVAVRALHEHQARLLICSIEVVVINRTNSTQMTAKPVRAFVNLKDGNERSYRDIATVMNSSVLRMRLLEQAHREMESWHRRYAQFTETEQIWKVWNKKVATKLKKIALKKKAAKV